MKKIIYTATLFMSLSGMLFAQQQADNSLVSLVSIEKGARISAPLPVWESTQYSFGKIAKGKPVSAIFTVKNNGDAPFLIQNVKPSCGCTTEDFSKEAIAPGQEGFVKLTYNAANVGIFSKSTIVTTNANPAGISLIFTGEVVAE